MKKLFYNLLLVGLLCTGVACGNNTQDNADEGKAPVSADDPRAPTVAPDKPTTDIGEGLEDSLQTKEQVTDTL